MKHLKQLVLGVLAVCMLLALVACGNGNETPSADPSATPTEGASANPSTDIKTVQEGKLVMATNAYFPPYEYYEGGKVVGIDVEIAQAVAEKMGLTLEVEDMEFNSIIAAVQSGKADIGVAGMTVREDRLVNVDFSDSYATGYQVVIVKEDSNIATPDDLEGKKVGVQEATTGDFYITDDYGDEAVERYNKGTEAVLALSQGKIDAVVIDREPAKSFVASTPGLKILETEYTVEDYAIAISKGNTALKDKINAILKELKDDGSLQSIIDKYIKA
ncbi:MAG: basic amino acid ABC transporter substrate-binding protein [Oscillospiraceae bacterium]|nr:basic amino acid ABC transporter substrate-binding protein [Oscillospiraceae bacterium]